MFNLIIIANHLQIGKKKKNEKPLTLLRKIHKTNFRNHKNLVVSTNDILMH